jgi:serine/threonine-protein kinase
MDGTGLRERLQAALGSAYALERELGRGGMSRVFVADETRFHRRVVIKVLAPELAAGLLLDRFEREVRLAAGLQDPHIVPVLSAGEVDGLPYYTMPYVAGPSLRERLKEPAATGGPLGLSEAVAILRDVARALAYAHAHGVVHRDIKPENVLLAGDTAVVADFGIAKALAASTTQAPTGGGPALGGAADGSGAAPTLTGLGMALGTPAYMAPEQATADVIDARADVYAWGVVAYELLAGRHPFAGKTTAPQLIAAQIAEMPAALSEVAPSVPPALAALVMRCLAKTPASRPATAAELVTALGEWSGGAHTGEHATAAARRRRGWRRLTAGLGLALVVLPVGAWYLTPAELRAVAVTLVNRPPPTYRVNRVVVAPFENETGDPRLASLGSLVADYVTDGLSRLPNLDVVDAGTRMQTAEVLRRVPRFLRFLLPADERALADETGAQVVVAGRYYVLGDSLHVRARILDAATGRVRTTLAPVSGPAAAPSAVVAAVRTRVVAALQAVSWEVAEDLAKLSPPPSLAAHDAFREGYQAFLRSFEHPMPDSAIFQPLRRAIALDSGYGAPAVTLAFAAANRDAYGVADSALAHARGLRDRLSPVERALLDLTDAWAQGDVQAALQAAQGAPPQVTAYYALLARRPRTAIAALRSTCPRRPSTGRASPPRTRRSASTIAPWTPRARGSAAPRSCGRSARTSASRARVATCARCARGSRHAGEPTGDSCSCPRFAPRRCCARAAATRRRDARWRSASRRACSRRRRATPRPSGAGASSSTC